MTEKDFFKLPLGEYTLTDSIDNYQYTLTVGLTDGKRRYYRIIVKGTIGAYNANVFMSESFRKNENGKREKYLHALCSVGGLFVHTEDVFSIIGQLKIIE